MILTTIEWNQHPTTESSLGGKKNNLKFWNTNHIIFNNPWVIWRRNQSNIRKYQEQIIMKIYIGDLQLTWDHLIMVLCMKVWRVQASRWNCVWILNSQVSICGMQCFGDGVRQVLANTFCQTSITLVLKPDRAKKWKEMQIGKSGASPRMETRSLKLTVPL